ncbi:MAG TPA: Crp/Fnr family transcriptional regulator [Allosphingosinicella sp.]
MLSWLGGARRWSRSKTREGEGALAAGTDCQQLIGQVFACAPEVASDIFRRGHLRAFPAEAALIRQGDPVPSTWLLVIGRAHALLWSAEGQMVLLQEFGPGDLFGALGELDPAPHEADVVAVEDVSAFLLAASDLVLLAERHGAIGLALARLLLHRLRKATTRVYERSALTAAGRVHAELLRRAGQAPDLAIRPAPVLSELAVQVGSTRETVSRAVNALERRGIIRREDGALVIVSARLLEELIL